jgi:hypothetical protein
MQTDRGYEQLTQPTSHKTRSPCLCPSLPGARMHSARERPRAAQQSACHRLDMPRPRRVDEDGDDDGGLAGCLPAGRCCHSQVPSPHPTTPLLRTIRRMRGACGRYSRLRNISSYLGRSGGDDALFDFFLPAPSLSTVSSVHITLRAGRGPPWR